MSGSLAGREEEGELRNQTEDPLTPQALLCCRAAGIWMRNRVRMVAAQAGFGSCQCVCCTHGEKLAKL